MCSAFHSLLAHAGQLQALRAEIHHRENTLLKCYQATDPVGNQRPMTEIDFSRFEDLLASADNSRSERAAAGKALFLETLGFEDTEVMAGNFLAAPDYVSGRYVGRLRPRHFALAWLALEGLLPERPVDVTAARRQEWMRVVGWTTNFHRCLMREYAAADLLVRERERASRVHAAMRWPWYAPVNEHPDWGAWAVVLELAIRRRSAAWIGTREDWRGAAEWVEPASADRPAVLIPNRSGGAARIAPRLCLSIEVPELRMMSTPREGSRALHLVPRVAIALRSHAVPWWQIADPRRLRNPDEVSRSKKNGRGGSLAPDPLTIWTWALGGGSDIAPPDASAQLFFGGSDVRPFGRDAA